MRSKLFSGTQRAAGQEQLDQNAALKASRIELVNKIQSPVALAPEDGDVCSYKGGSTTVFSKHGLEAPFLTSTNTGSSSAMKQLKVERYLKRAKMILESAWLITQELNLQKAEVEAGEIDQQ